MVKYYVSDLWSDTSGHFFMFGTDYAYYNYPTIYLNQPATNYKQSKEVNTTYPNHLYGFKICRAKMTGNIITIEGYFGAYHYYDNTRANFAFAIVPSSYVDVDSVPPNFLIIYWVLSTYGWGNGTYELYAKVQFRINSDNTITVLSATPANPTFYYSSPYGLIGQDVTVLFGYVDAWLSNWSQWACARNDSYIDLPSLVTTSLTESLGLKDSAVKASSVVRRELLGLSDVYGRTWTAYRTYTEPLGLSDVVVKNLSVAKAESLGLSDDVAVKAPSVVRAESLGLLDYYSRLWSVHRTYSENLGLADYVQKSSSTVKSELLGLSDVAEKSSSILKFELLGLSDFYSRTWTAYRTYTESLGLSDKVVKTAEVPLAETLGLLDTVTKSSFTTKTEKIGLADLTVKGVSVPKTERLGLSDVLRKAPGKAFSEALGLKDVYRRVFHRTFTEPLGLKDAVSKGVALHALVEVLGLYDSILYAPNVTVLAKLIRKYMQLVNLGGDWNE